MSEIKLYDTYRKVKGVFVKPKLRVYFGLWKNDPNLPVWRSGPIVHLVRRKYRFNQSLIGIHSRPTTAQALSKRLKFKAYRVTDNIFVKTGVSQWADSKGVIHDSDKFESSYHKLPGGLKDGDLVWRRDIRKKLKKWHLSWIKPEYHLPIWLSFYYINHDLHYKSKWDTWRYEFPPQFTIVAFGVSLTFTLHCPIKDYYSCDDHYWECILEYLYGVGHNSVIDTLLNCGYWSAENCKYHQLRREYLKKGYQKEYDAALVVFNKKHKNITVL